MQALPLLFPCLSKLSFSSWVLRIKNSEYRTPINNFTATFLFLILSIFFSPGSSIALDELSDGELDEIYAAGLLAFSVTPGSSISACTGLFSCNAQQVVDNTDKTFVRINLDTQLNLQATIDSLKLGYYNDSQLGYNNGTGWDVDLGGFDLGRGQDLEADQGLYIELAFRDWNLGASGRELVGMRLGLPHVRGDIGIADINTLSGFLKASLLITLNIRGHREDGLLVTLADALAQGVGLDDTSDFWLSLNRENIYWEYMNPTNSGAMPDDNDVRDHTDLSGYFLHVTENVGAKLF